MNLILKNTIISTAVIAFFAFGFVPPAAAQTIDVEFENDPLFTATSTGPLMPGDEIATWFTVTNEGDNTQTVYIRTLNDSDTNDLADALIVSIRDGLTEEYGAQLSDLFSRDNKSDSPPIGDLTSGESRTFDFIVTFAPEAGNTYQGGSASFDFCVGFDGGNENCITGTGTDPDDGGGGGGGGGGNGDNPDDDNDPPPGIIAGESTSLPASVIGAVNNFVRGLVLGEETSTDEEDEATTTNEDITDAIGEPNRTSSPAAILFDETYCLLVWLLLLGFMLLGWSAYEDKFRFGGTAFNNLFLRNVIFTAVYSALLVLFHVLGILGGFWWIFAAAWAIMATFDYRAHDALLPLYDTTYRTAFYGGVSAVLILTSFLFGFPCDWWPFLIVMVASGLLYIFNET